MNKKRTERELASAIKLLFSVSEEVESDMDLSQYIKDSIDLGELIAVIKEQYGVSVSNLQLFKTYSRFSDVLKIFNNEL